MPDHELYEAIRKDPTIGLAYQLDDVRMELEPPFASQSFEGARPLLPELKWVRQQWDVVNQLKSEITGWRKKHADMLVVIDELQKLLDKKKSKYD